MAKHSERQEEDNLGSYCVAGICVAGEGCEYEKCSEGKKKQTKELLKEDQKG